MNNKNLKTNILLNNSRIILNLLFPLITFPYISRVLGSESIGKVEYASSIVSYFILFSELGIPIYGIREVSKVKDDTKKRSALIFEILIILGITTIISLILYVYLIINTKILYSQLKLMLVVGISIVFNSIGLEWFYIGIEDQLYITKRFVYIKIISLILLFTLVKTENNYIIYAVILVSLNSFSNIFNLIRLKKYVSFKGIHLNDLQIKRHYKPILVVFIASIAKSIYLRLDSIMIGTMVGNNELGYYSTANKLLRIIITLVTSLGIVIIPRLTNFIKNKEFEKYSEYTRKSLSFMLFLGIPGMFFTIFFSKELILSIAGEGFKSSILTMQIIAPIIIISGIANFLAYQVLYPHNLERMYTYAVITAAVVNFLLNYFLISYYGQNGAALSTVIAEFLGIAIMFVFSKELRKKYDFFDAKNYQYFISTLIILILGYFLNQIRINLLARLFLIILISGISYIWILILIKNPLVLEGYNEIKVRLKK